jgi:hypothetical protein
MKALFFIAISIFLSLYAGAQTKYEIKLVNKIKGFKSDSELNNYLIKNKLIPTPKDSLIYFHAGKIQVDVFRKNLFNGKDDEIIFQLREKEAYSVNVFFYKDKVFTKVPGQIFVLPIQSSGYGEQSFTFFFENIFKSDYFSIVTRNYSEFVRSTTEMIEILNIKEDTIHSIDSFELNASTYSGVLTYNYKTFGTYEFVSLNNSFPKVLIINKEIKNEYADKRNDDLEILSGNIKEGSIKTTTYFDEVNGYWVVAGNDEEQKIKTRNIKKEE